MRLLLLSNGTVEGRPYLAHALVVLGRLLPPGSRVAFVPFAKREVQAHTSVVANALAPLDVVVTGVHEHDCPRRVVDAADAIFVGGGNTFRLLAALYRLDLMTAIRRRCAAGAGYVGTSAGANIACPTARTTNDMPIVQPPTLQALDLVPFQINAHYPPREDGGPHLGETRDQRIAEFLQENDVAVLGLREGSWVAVHDDQAVIGGVAGARLFRRGAAPAEVGVRADVSALLATRGTFDITAPE